MKSCLGILLVFFTFVAVVGGGALIWYLSSSSEFSRKAAPPATSGSALAFEQILAAIGEAAAFNAPGSDYKALVCVFLFGGNDSFNTVLATDAAAEATSTPALAGNL